MKILSWMTYGHEMATSHYPLLWEILGDVHYFITIITYDRACVTTNHDTSMCSYISTSITYTIFPSRSSFDYTKIFLLYLKGSPLKLFF
jgi:hypothetical protein